MSETDDLPEAFGYTIFCDDIRDEIGGKKSYVGVYSGMILVNDPFPVLLPKFGFSFTLFQKRASFVSNPEFQVYLPGDNDSPTLRVTGKSEDGSKSLDEQLQESRAPNDIGKPLTDLVRMDFGGIISPLILKQEGDILSRVRLAERVIKLGRLQVRLSKQGIEKTAAKNKSDKG